ncbi:ParB/RepB/Spo0J family partition protein, partial [Vibrio alfacsensis]
VRSVGHEQFEIIAGERRWRAARQAGLKMVPCLVKNVQDRAAVAMALIENIQREDLNAIEEAQALERLQDEFELTHQQVADVIGKSRTAVSNLLR